MSIHLEIMFKLNPWVVLNINPDWIYIHHNYWLFKNSYKTWKQYKKCQYIIEKTHCIEIQMNNMEVLFKLSPDIAFDVDPDWVALNQPLWAISNKEDFMINNYPHKVLQHRPTLMVIRKLDWVVKHHPQMITNL